MERKLLLLGLLRMGDMHGYQLNDVIESHLGGSVNLKKATAYDLLKKMAQDGWCSVSEEREGNRPPRQVYTITPAGEAMFQTLLRESLAAYKPVQFASDISIAFLDVLPRDEARALLQQRRELIAELLAEHNITETHPGSMQYMLEHQQRHLSTELDWIDTIITRLIDTP